MNNKQLFIIIVTITSSSIKAFLGVGETIAAGNFAYKVGKYGYNYVYNTEENKAIIKKHLSSRSYLIHGCEENLSQSCIGLAEHYRNLEEYHKVSTLKRELNNVILEMRPIIEKSLKIAQENRTKMNLPDDNGPYLQSLSEDEKNKAYDLMRILIEEKNGIENYAQELKYLHESLNK